tara:strand:+ start:1090 stop:2133 length:1044 start_codon:yes stop_codon:yes gene_type:complete
LEYSTQKGFSMILAKDIVTRALRLLGVMEDYDPTPNTVQVTPADIIDRALRSIEVSERFDANPPEATISVNRVLTRALRLLSVAQAGESLEAAQVQDSLMSLNAMLATWQSKKIINSAPTLTSGGDMTVAASVVEPIIYNLALRISPEYGVQMSEEARLVAQTGYASSSRQNLDCLPEFNSMLHQWDAGGLIAGFTDLAYADTLTISPKLIAPLVNNLAIQLAPKFTIQVTPETQVLAAQGYEVARRITLDHIPALNSLLHEWEHDGIYMEHIDLDFDDAISYEEGHVDPIIYNLALRIAPNYPVQLSPVIYERAEKGYRHLQNYYNDIDVLTTQPALDPSLMWGRR